MLLLTHHAVTPSLVVVQVIAVHLSFQFVWCFVVPFLQLSEITKLLLTVQVTGLLVSIAAHFRHTQRLRPGCASSPPGPIYAMSGWLYTHAHRGLFNMLATHEHALLWLLRYSSVHLVGSPLKRRIYICCSSTRRNKYNLLIEANLNNTASSI